MTNDANPAGRVKTPEPKPMIAVGGSLHGMTVLVPYGSTAVYTDNGFSVDVTPDSFDRPRSAGPAFVPAFRAAPRFELYRVQYRGWVGLLISAQLLGTADKPKGLDQTIVEALGIAAGVWSERQPLIDVDELRKA